MVALRGVSRKAKFAAALVEAGIGPSTFAREIGHVSKTQLYRVLRDPSQSAPLTSKIDAFIEEQLSAREEHVDAQQETAPQALAS